MHVSMMRSPGDRVRSHGAANDAIEGGIFFRGGAF